jgi:hypothetical protein
MAGIYGNSAEDKYFEDKLNEYLDKDLDVCGSFWVDDWRIVTDDTEYSFDLRVRVRNSQIDNVEVFVSQKYDWELDDWVDFEYDVSEFYKDGKLLDYLFDSLEI